MTARRSGTLAAALVAVGMVLAVVLVTWAASIGPSEVLRGDGPDAAPSAPPTSQEPETTADPTAEPTPEESTTDDGVRPIAVVAVLLNIATVAVALLLLAWAVRWLARLRRVRRSLVAQQAAAATADVDVLAPGPAVARELLADAEAQVAVLTGGTPRNGIVECWHRFEVAAATVGIERHAWETSSEHTLRVLNLVEAEPVAITQLADLYREARFSEHELTEDDRAVALEALAAVHGSIGVRA